MAPAFARSADFAWDKPAGRPCHQLRPDLGCSIHERLRDSGMPGCAVFDCFGAGQHVVQATFGGRDWRESPALASSVFAVFPVVRQLHELLWYLAEADALLDAGALRAEVGVLQEATRRLAAAAPDELARVDLAAHRARAGPLLRRVSAALRSGTRGPERAGADLVGARLRGADLRGADLRGAYLLGADLRAADLRLADLLGADLRGADLRGARLGTALFLTRPQLDAATGDVSTGLPPSLPRPAHWS